jgi:polar amino acid transport system permease protein
VALLRCAIRRRLAGPVVGHPLRHGYAGVRLDQNPVPLLHRTRLRNRGPVTTAVRSLLIVVGFNEDIQVNGFAAAVATLGFVQGAYSTEVLRGAILSVPKGQIEAAKAYGMPSMLRFRRILFPLMFRYALPGLSNLWVNILKDSSLISVVGLSELVFTGKTAAASTKHYFFFYLVTAAIFLVLTTVSNLGISYIERRTSRGVRRA